MEHRRDDKEGDKLRLAVSDNGVGFAEIPDMAGLEHSQHTGLYNVYRRLELRYGSDFSFSIASQPGEGATVSISIPMEEKE